MVGRGRSINRSGMLKRESESGPTGMIEPEIRRTTQKKRLIPQKFYETLMKWVFAVSGCAAIASVALICVFLFANGIPAMREIGLWKFLSGTVWDPQNDVYGILPMILGSVYVTGGALLIGVPVGILTAAFMSSFCPKRLYRALKPAINLLAGIPSVVYGFFGLSVIVPAVRYLFGGSGTSMLSASVVLGIMILPTVIGVSEAAIAAVPSSYYEGSLALGAGHERSVFKCVLPAAKSGIFAAVILGVGRAVGETMAVVMVAGNQPVVPSSVVRGLRTLTANIVIEMGYAADLHREALIATGVVLFVFILIINCAFSLIKSRNKI